MSLPTHLILILLVALQGALLGGVFLTIRYFQSPANRQLAITFFAVSISAINYSLLNSGMDNKWLVLCNDIMWEYLFPASLLLYFVHGLQHPLGKQKQRFYLFLPFIITLIVNIIIDFDLDFGLYRLGWVHNETILDIYYGIEEVGTLVFAIGTCIYSYWIVRHYPPEVATNWFKQFWWWSCGVVLLWILLWLLDQVPGWDVIGYVFAAIMILFTWVTYQGVLRFRLAEEKFEIRQILQERSGTAALSDSAANDNPHFQRLERLMQEQHLYREPDLSRDALAQKLGISNGYLSQQLSAMGTSFADYINHYRVEEVKLLLLDPAFAQYSLLAIGYEAGFNSKSTFYAAFKKATGLSPSAFREQAAQSS